MILGIDNGDYWIEPGGDWKGGANAMAGRRAGTYNGEEMTTKELIAYCREELAGFKIPKKIEFGPIDKTSTGKVQKYLLREKAEKVAYTAKK